MAQEAEFPKGVIVKRPKETAPDFVKADVSIKVDDLIEYLQNCNPKSGWWNGQIKESREGKLYISRDTYEAPDPSANQAPKRGF